MRRRIGTITLNTKTTFHYAGYECAAWWKDVECCSQSVELWYCDEGYKSVGFRFIGKIVRDNFQSLFCGNACGKAYDELQNAGKDDTYHTSMYDYNLIGLLYNHAYRVVLDDDVTVTADVKVLGREDFGGSFAHTAVFARIAFKEESNGRAS
jgi:hypothetical protein